MPTFYFESLGCAKNLVDSEIVISKLLRLGITEATSPEEADYIFINTCCFIEDAKKESIDKILELAEYKKNSDKKLVILGCMAVRYGEILRKELPEVDRWIKISDYPVFEKTFLSESKAGINLKRPTFVSLTAPHWSYLRIADGCRHNCSFCAIPKIRGPLKSENMEHLLRLAREKAARGVKELNIIAQDSLSYGIDIYKKRALVDLLKKLCKIKELKWIRILYMYPSYINDELLDYIKSEEKICKYFDIPLQHTGERILKLMKRPHNAKYYETLIEKIRGKIPEAFIRTTFITGFPSEGKADFNELLKFIKKIKFNHLGAFIYSDEEGTAAHGFKNKINLREKQKRLDEIMLAQQDVLKEKNKCEIGKIYDVIIDNVGAGPCVCPDGRTPLQYNYTGRTKFDAPEIDRNFYLKTDKKLKIGDIVKARVTKADLYDLEGVLYRC